MRTPIRLRTPRLVLDELTLADAEFLLELFTDPAFMAKVGDRQVRTREQAEAYLRDRALPSYVRQGFGSLAVRLEDGGRPIGLCGLIKREGLADVDLGYALLPGFRGAGHAREAARAVLDWALGELGLTRVVAIVAVGNARSIALLEQLGLVHESMITLPGKDEVLRLYACGAVMDSSRGP